jgi:hypothetical protein
VLRNVGILKFRRPEEFFYIYLPMKLEQTECSETLAYKIQTPGNYSEESIKTMTCLHDFLASTGTTGKRGGKLVAGNLSARRETGHRQLIGREGNWSQTSYRLGEKLVTENLSAKRETGHRQLIDQEGNWSKTTYRPGGKLVTDNLSPGRFVSLPPCQSPSTRPCLKIQKSQ